MTTQERIVDLGQQYQDMLMSGSGSKEGILQTIVDFFINEFSISIGRLISYLIPFFLLLTIIDILIDLIKKRGQGRLFEQLKYAITILLNFAIGLVLISLWVNVFFKEFFEITTQKIPAIVLDYPDGTVLTVDRVATIFTAPFIVMGNILYENSKEIVDMISKGNNISEIQVQLADLNKNVFEGVPLIGKVFEAGKYIYKGIGIIVRAGINALNLTKGGVFGMGLAFFGTIFFTIKIMTFIGRVLLNFLFATLTVAVAFGMGTFNFFFSSKNIVGLNGGKMKILRIILNAIARFSIISLFISIASNKEIPLTPLWTAQQIATRQDANSWLKDVNSFDTFLNIIGYWLFIIMFLKLFEAVQKQEYSTII